MEVTRINHESTESTINRQLPTFYLCFTDQKKCSHQSEGPFQLGFPHAKPRLASPKTWGPPLVNAGHDTVEKGVRHKRYSDVDTLAMRLNIDINMIHISIFTVFYNYFWCGSCWQSGFGIQVIACRGWCLYV